jgi:hypothetical protein
MRGVAAETALLQLSADSDALEKWMYASVRGKPRRQQMQALGSVGQALSAARYRPPLPGRAVPD